jgi:hypothetical protein
MRDLVVREALEAMARDAAKRFRELVAAGEEIPYDVEEPGGGSPLPRYVPLTGRFVREHAPLLRELDSFGAGCAAIESAQLAAPYLEDCAVKPPPDPRRRAELAGMVFLARLWHDSTDFSLDEARLRAASAELQANSDPGQAEIEVIVPLRGLRMEGTRAELATATIVRADTVEVPAEARAPEASGGAGWEPTFLAVARVEAEAPDAGGETGPPDAGTRSVEAFRELITTLRLFKGGGVALGPHAWTRVGGGGRWRRISTGAGRPRPGGYRLAEAELSRLAAFSRAIASRLADDDAIGRARLGATAGLGRAISRFEAGMERTTAIDALNDYLLALRFLLEGGGPADLGLSMRVASLCADPDGRSEVKAVIDRALALERELWSGEPPAGGTGATPTETAIAVEDLARAILKDAACGHLGTDLRATADEILLADGLAVGDGAAEQRGATAEWSPTDSDEEAPVEPAEPEKAVEPMEAVEPAGMAEPARAAVPAQSVEPAQAAEGEPDGPRYGRDAPVVGGELWFQGTRRDAEESVQVIRQPERIRIERTIEEETTIMEVQPAHSHEPSGIDRDSPVLRLLELHSAEREATQARVANLFPPPETTEWDVREISYDRTRRAGARDDAS